MFSGTGDFLMQDLLGLEGRGMRPRTGKFSWKMQFSSQMDRAGVRLSSGFPIIPIKVAH